MLFLEMKAVDIVIVVVYQLLQLNQRLYSMHFLQDCHVLHLQNIAIKEVEYILKIYLDT